MSYQVLARKWRPQTFEAVVGQPAVTRTLRNALASGRLAHAFVFAGPRGVGKTTSARILARALNCVKGPTPDPCGTCDACVEIAEGRDIDVLEIDAATHTQVDNVREVIISGLAIAPVRNRYKIFIIDEVHQLSNSSFNALLKSIEEPPPHVVFMMATTELDKIPETVLSRSQVFEFRTISTKSIVEQLRRIADAEGLTVADESLMLIARDAEGSMRDAQSKLDQVIAFTGRTIAAEDVATVLGLVGRDLLLDAVQAVADDDARAAFAVSGRAVELGYDLRSVCRELTRVVRDLLVLSVDPARISDQEIAAEGERDRLTALAGRFSREDLLRAFDLLTRAEMDIRTAAQPRHHLEMAMLRWIYLRKIRPIEELMAGAPSADRAATAPARVAERAAPRMPAATMPAGRLSYAAPAPVPPNRVERPATTAASGNMTDAPPGSASASGNVKDAFLAEIRKTKVVFYNTVVAQSQKIELAGDRITFAFLPNQRTLRDAFEEKRSWLESIAHQATGRKLTVAAVQGESAAASAGVTPAGVSKDPGPETGKDAEGEAATNAAKRQKALREQALADRGVQAMLEVFPAEIRDVEEM